MTRREGGAEQRAAHHMRHVGDLILAHSAVPAHVTTAPMTGVPSSHSPNPESCLRHTLEQLSVWRLN